MRVAILVDGFSGIGGGITTYLQALLSALPDAGIDPLVIGGQLADDPPGAPYVHVDGLDADRRRLAAQARVELESELRSFRPAVVYDHVVSPDAARVAADVAPVVFFAHEYLTVCPGGSRFLHRSRTFCSEGPGARCFWRAYSERTTNRRPDRLLAAYARTRGWQEGWTALSRLLVASEAVRDTLVGSGAPESIIDVVPYPVVSPPAAETEAPIDVLYLGRLTDTKGVDVLLRAHAELGDARLVIAGEGPQRAELEALVADLGTSVGVEFRGWVGGRERAALLAAARVLALPSLWEEAFGIAGVEALAAGVPVVASRTGGIPSWLDESAGILVPPDDVEALVSALRELLGNEPRRSQLGAAGIGVAARFDMQKHVDLLLQSFDRAIARVV
jgi:glycosyltransferase involved in cell wall biosynthesis